MPEPTVQVGDLGNAPVIPILLILAGGYLAWFGVHYWRRDIKWPSDPVKSVLRGKGVPPPGQIVTSTDILMSIQEQTPASGGVSDGSIASTALTYKGHCYFYGGAPGKDGKGCWDCSSFVNFVLAIRLGMAIPGYRKGMYDGTVHGPTTLSYLAWSGAATVGHASQDAQAGDLCVWQTHMGIAIGNGQMISALNPALGTKVTSIDGIVTGELLHVRRVNGAGTVVSPQPSGSSGGTGSGGTQNTQWWIFGSKDGNRFFVASAPTLAAAQKKAKAENATVFGGPFPTQAAAQGALP